MKWSCGKLLDRINRIYIENLKGNMILWLGPKYPKAKNKKDDYGSITFHHTSASTITCLLFLPSNDSNAVNCLIEKQI